MDGEEEKKGLLLWNESYPLSDVMWNILLQLCCLFARHDHAGKCVRVATGRNPLSLNPPNRTRRHDDPTARKVAAPVA